TAVMVAVHQVVRRQRDGRALARSLAAAAGVYLMAVGPVALQYLRLERDPSFRRAPDATFFTHWPDFRAVALDNRFVGHWWPVAGGAAVNHELSRRPNGVVLELPALSQTSGAAWTFVEAPRELASTIDWKPRVNGVSGFEPGRGFGALVTTLNRFPAAPAWPV